MDFRVGLLATVAVMVPVVAGAQTALRGSISQDPDGSLSSRTVIATGSAGAARPTADWMRDIPRPQAESSVPGMLGSGAVNAQPALAAAWAKGAARIPCGVYRLDSPLPAPASNTALLAESAGCVQMNINFSTGDIISIGSTISHVEIKGIRFSPLVAHTSGALIHNMGINVDLDYLISESDNGSKFFDGVVNSGSYITRTNHIYVSNMTGDCFRADATGSGGSQQQTVDWHADTINTALCGNGLHLRSIGGFYPHAIDILQSSANGVLVDPVGANGDSVLGVLGDTILADSGVGPGFQFAGTGNINEVNLTNAWASSSGSAGPTGPINTPSQGILFNNPSIDGVTLTSARAINNGGQGIQIAQGKHISLVAPHALMNAQSYNTVPPAGGTASTTRYPGIEIDGGADHISISAPISGVGGRIAATGGTNQQNFGLYRAAGSGGQTITVMGGQFPGNTALGYQINSASGDHITDLGNVNY